MAIKLTFLGTSSMIPTKDRNHSAVFVRHTTEGLLFDCGEGTQRQFTIAKIPLPKITRMFISHWHGDHTLGIPGLLQTLAWTAPGQKLFIYGPKGTKKRIEKMEEVFEWENTLELTIEDIKEGVFLKTRDFTVEAVALDHSAPCFGYIFKETDQRRMNQAKLTKLGISGPDVGKLQDGKTIAVGKKKIKPDEVSRIEKGKKLGIIADTQVCRGCDKIAKDADLLISEASFMKDLEEKAHAHSHMTATEAAQIASRNNVKRLFITHFSARYKEDNDIVQEAKDVFPETQAARDFLNITV